MANPSISPMEPIKEETKYTLFEDAKKKNRYNLLKYSI